MYIKSYIMVQKATLAIVINHCSKFLIYIYLVSHVITVQRVIDIDFAFLNE